MCPKSVKLASLPPPPLCVKQLALHALCTSHIYMCTVHVSIFIYIFIYDKVSANVMISVQKMGESESDQMVF